MKLKNVKTILAILSILTAIFTVTTVVSQEPQRGPEIDKLRFQVIQSPDAKLLAMKTCISDVWSYLHAFCNTEALIFECPGEKRIGDIEELDAEGFTILTTPAFHVKFSGVNIRPDQSYRRPEITFWPLADVSFRHALVHCYDQEGIVASIKGYTATPIRSLIPPAQGGWVNPGVPAHPYNPGDPFTSTPGDGTSCGILKASGYTFVDADASATVTPPDFWLMPNGDPLPDLRMFTPTYEASPTQYEHGARFIADLAEIALAGTPENGWRGLIHEPMEYQIYLKLVHEHADFDIYMAGLALGRFPDYLYSMCHSSQDSQPHPWRFNAPGIDDPELDEKLETLKFSLNHPEKLLACYSAQEELYDENYPNCAFAYIPMYSRIYFNAYKQCITGIVNSPGFGSDNMWAFLNIHWTPGHPNERIEDGKSTLNWILCGEPERLNPLYGYTAKAWEIMARTMDCLIEVNPYTLEYKPWLATGWEVVETPAGPGAMAVTFWLRDDVCWQDGTPYTAEDARFNWLFLRDNQIPRYASMWEHIVQVDVIDPFTVKVYLDVTSQFLFYDLACTAALLPPQVWADWDGRPLVEILARDPSVESGWNGVTPTNLFGTGPFIFDWYDPIIMWAELLANRQYFKTTDEIHAQLVEMFHRIGDVNYDGVICDVDIAEMLARFGCMAKDFIAPGVPPVDDPCYDPNVDVNSDGIINGGDLSLANFYYGQLREYPGPCLGPVERTIEKTLSVSEGGLGDVVHVTLGVTVPAGETATVVDTLPSELSYVDGTFSVDGVPAIPTVTKSSPPPPIITELSYTLTEFGTHVIEFDCEVDSAYWEDREVCDVATATWYDEMAEVVDEKEATACFTIHAFEELSKSIHGGLCDGGNAEYLYVDGYEPWMENGWSNSGVSLFGVPDGVYAESFDDCSMTSLYSFEDIELAGRVVKNVELEAYSKCEYTANDIDSYIFTYDELGNPVMEWAWADSQGGTTDWAWTNKHYYNCMMPEYYGDHILTEQGINSAKMLIHNYGGGSMQVDAYRLKVEFDPYTIKAETETQWTLVMEVTNPFSYTMKNVTIKDNFGAELEIDEVITTPDVNYDGIVDIFDLSKVAMSYGAMVLEDRDRWDPMVDLNKDGIVDIGDIMMVCIYYGDTLWYYTTGESDKIHLFWYIGDLPPGETARIEILVSTDLNPADHQEYTEPGVYEMNSGATLKFEDCTGTQLSATTDSIYVTVLPLEDP